MWSTHTHTHTYDGIFPSREKEWNLAVCNNMDRPRIILLSDISQTERQIMGNFTDVWKIKLKRERERNRLTDTENGLARSSEQGRRLRAVSLCQERPRQRPLVPKHVTRNSIVENKLDVEDVSPGETARVTRDLVVILLQK